MVEAASLGTPGVVVAAPDNAAMELVEEGVNGFVVDERRAPDALAAAIVRVHERGRRGCGERTRDWFARNASGCRSTARSTRVAASYGAASARS